ncbi:ATP-binding cassette domain-containing protein [Martelella sp. AD-3]|uniref:ABC transporter ATP-binding protein n=1 Tax=Martelella sp. AD-3 TaxID=686597 RepID=UPI000467CF8B|nr:ATP-binding cassette domain-containing protein [Martelella sp. AD-3]AMM83475.1 nickel ABC transporter ATP-binding protein [Martelella sp. AD-3]
MLEARNIHFRYRARSPVLDGIGLALRPGEVVGLTGPSGGGKSTLGRILAGHYRPASGQVLVDGAGHPRGFNPVQYLHQSPVFAVNPRWTVGKVLAEAWQPDAELRRAFGVSRSWLDRYPHEISGGELQRVALLRAFAPQTRYLIADEISAQLDPLTQAQIWSVLLEQAESRRLGVLIISHDMPLLGRIAERVVTI